MNISISDYSNPYQSFLIEAFNFEVVRNFLSIPKMGTRLSTYIFKKMTPIYTRMLLEISGLSEYIDELNNKDIKELIRTFNKILVKIDVINNQKRFFEKNEAGVEFISIIQKLSEKINENIFILEDKLHAHFTYSLSVNNVDNDWNSPENDHWDNY